MSLLLGLVGVGLEQRIRVGVSTTDVLTPNGLLVLGLGQGLEHEAEQTVGRTEGSKNVQTNFPIIGIQYSAFCKTF